MNHIEQSMLYAMHQLDELARAEFEKHLQACAECQVETKFWSQVADEIHASSSTIPAPAHLAESTLTMIHAPSPLRRAYRYALLLLRTQALLIHHELWIGSAVLIVVLLALSLITTTTDTLYFFVPMIAAGAMTLIYGADNDPALELTIATPLSPWKILLARLALVSAYNIILALGATFCLLIVIPPHTLGQIILGWLAPLTFLSALALVLALWIGTSNAIFIVYSLWVAQYASFVSLDTWFTFLAPWVKAYQQFWHSPLLLFSFGSILVLVALWSTTREPVQWRRSLTN